MRKLIFAITVLFIFSGLNLLANKTSVDIKAPATVKKGSEVTIIINVTHKGNSKMHHTDWVTLKAPWNTLENTWVLVAVAILLLIETVVDKIPAVDTINDVIQTFIRPAAGAILFAAGSNIVSDISPIAAMICGLLVAGGVHAAKATTRPIITAGTAGTGNPIISTVEDVVSGVSAFVAIVLPVLAAIFFAALLGLYIWWRVRRYRSRAASACGCTRPRRTRTRRTAGGLSR